MSLHTLDNIYINESINKNGVDISYSYNINDIGNLNNERNYINIDLDTGNHYFEDKVINNLNEELENKLYEYVYDHYNLTKALQTKPPITPEKFKYDKELTKKDLYPKTLPYESLNNLSNDSFNKVKQLMNNYNERTGKLNNPFIIKDNEVIMLDDAMKNKDKYNFDRKKFEVHISPNYYATINYNNPDKDFNKLINYEINKLDKYQQNIKLSSEEYDLRDKLYSTNIKRLDAIYNNDIKQTKQLNNIMKEDVLKVFPFEDNYRENKLKQYKEQQKNYMKENNLEEMSINELKNYLNQKNKSKETNLENILTKEIKQNNELEL